MLSSRCDALLLPAENQNRRPIYALPHPFRSLLCIVYPPLYPFLSLYPPFLHLPNSSSPFLLLSSPIPYIAATAPANNFVNQVINFPESGPAVLTAASKVSSTHIIKSPISGSFASLSKYRFDSGEFPILLIWKVTADFP
jgi:hypothetical protein